MTLSDIKNYVYRRTKTNSTSIPAADMLIMVNNALERVESLIRPWFTAYNATRFTSSDLSTGTAAPKFNSRFHEVIGLWISLQYGNENGLKSAIGIASELSVKEDEMVRWYGLHNFREAIIEISTGILTLDNHGFMTNDRIIFETTGALPTGLSAETWYYVIYQDSNTIKLSSTRNGSAISTSGSQSGTHFIGVESQGGFGRRMTIGGGNQSGVFGSGFGSSNK